MDILLGELNSLVESVAYTVDLLIFCWRKQQIWFLACASLMPGLKNSSLRPQQIKWLRWCWKAIYVVCYQLNRTANGELLDPCMEDFLLRVLLMGLRVVWFWIDGAGQENTSSLLANGIVNVSSCMSHGFERRHADIAVCSTSGTGVSSDEVSKPICGQRV